jgi:hypothetical protein
MSAIRSLYRFLAIANDIKAISTGNPNRIGKRLVNKWLGRNVVRRMWLR